MEYPKSNLNRVKRGSNRASYDQNLLHEILDAGFLCHVAYPYDGYAITIPMAYARDGEHIYLHGSTGNRMLRSLADNSKLSLTVSHLDGLVLARSGLHHSVNYRSAVVFGSVQTIEDDATKEEVLALVVDHMIADRWNTLRPITKKELDRTLVLKLTIETASIKVRAEGVNDEEEDEHLPIWAGVIPIQQIALEPIADQGKPQNMETPHHIQHYCDKNRYKPKE